MVFDINWGIQTLGKSKGSKSCYPEKSFYLNLSLTEQAKLKLFAETCGFKSYKCSNFLDPFFLDIFLGIFTVFLPENLALHKTLGFACSGTWLSGQGAIKNVAFLKVGPLGRNRMAV